MTSEVKIRNVELMENENENESLRTRIIDIEEENQDLRAQNLLQKRTILQMRDEIFLLRLRLSRMFNPEHFLTDANLTQNSQQNDGTVGQITVPPLMAPPPTPPPLPPARVRISPRQVGAGEALTTPLGVTISSPPRHRIKRDCRQGLYRSPRNPYRRFDVSEPGPSTTTTAATTTTTMTTTTTTTPTLISSERPNYFVGLRIIPQFQKSFICSPTQSSGYSDSASDSSGSDETTPLLTTKVRQKQTEGESSLKNPQLIPRDIELLKNVRNLHHQKVRQTILQNYSLSLPNSGSNTFFPVALERENLENVTTPSTSGNDVNQNNPTENDQEPTSNGTRKLSRISDCVQYTFPTIHEGLNHQGVQSAVTATGPVSRLRKLKKNIPYSQIGFVEHVKTGVETEEERAKFVREKNQKNQEISSMALDSESLSSTDEGGRSRTTPLIITRELASDLEQDGFQADESSNCMTSAENSLEKLSISDSNLRK